MVEMFEVTEEELNNIRDDALVLKTLLQTHCDDNATISVCLNKVDKIRQDLLNLIPTT